VAQSKPSDHGLAIVKGCCKVNKKSEKLTVVSLFLFYAPKYKKAGHKALLENYR